MVTRLENHAQLFAIASPSIHDTLRQLLFRGDVHGIAVYEVVGDAGEFGERSYRPFGPGCDHKTLADCVASPLYPAPIAGVSLPTKTVTRCLIKPDAPEATAQPDVPDDSDATCVDVPEAAQPPDVVAGPNDPDSAG